MDKVFSFHQTRSSNEKPIDFPLPPSAAKMRKCKPLHCYHVLLLFHPSLNGQMKEGNSSQVLLHTLNLSFFCSLPCPPSSFSRCTASPLLPFACLPLSIYLSVTRPLPPFCLSLPLSWCKVMEAGVWVSESTPQGLYCPLA